MSRVKKQPRTTKERFALLSRFPRVQGAVKWLLPPLETWRRALPAFGFALFSVILLRFCYMPFHLSFLSLIALVPLFWGISHHRPNMALWIGWFFGTLHSYTFLLFLHSTAQYNPLAHLGVPVLAVWMGLHIAVALAVLVVFARRLPPWGALVLGAMAWAGMEYFRMIGAFGCPYGFLGHSLAGWLSFAQGASLGGVPLLSAVLVAVNLAIMELIAAFRAKYGHAGAIARTVTMLLIIFGLHFWGREVRHDTLAIQEDPEAILFNAALLQPNIPQEMKYASYASPDPAEKQRLQRELAVLQLNQIDEVAAKEYDLIVTPESSFTVDLFDSDLPLQREIYVRAADLDTSIIVGATDYTYRNVEGEPVEAGNEGFDPVTGEAYPGWSFYGGLWVFRPPEQNLKPKADYRKVQLMPFGETVPYFNLIPGFAEKIVQIAPFSAGEKGVTIEIPTRSIRRRVEGSNVRIGPSICYEDLFPWIHRAMVKEGVQLFVNTTNDAWFDPSSGSAWHADMARWRSIESRIPMVRCTNSGVTCLIDGTGEITNRLERMDEGILRLSLYVQEEPEVTFYMRWGNWFGLLGLLGGILMWGIVLKTRPDPGSE